MSIGLLVLAYLGYLGSVKAQQDFGHIIIVKKTQLTTGDEYIPPGLSIYSYRVGNNEPVDFMDSSNLYSIGDTIRGKQK